MRENADSLLCLPGTAEEKKWLEDRLEMLSVNEKLVLVAAVERSPPRDMKDAVNCLLTLDCMGAGDHRRGYHPAAVFLRRYSDAEAQFRQPGVPPDGGAGG